MILQSDIIAALGGWGYFFLIIVLALLIMVFSLKVGIGAVKGNKTEMGTVFITGLLAWIILAISTWILSYFLNLGWLGFIIAIIIAILVIKSRHDTTFFGAIGAILIAIVVLVLLMWLIMWILNVNFMGLFNGLLNL